MQDFSIPNLSPKEQEHFIKLVDEILLQKETNNLDNIRKLEVELDKLVYMLYNLDGDEIKLLENKD